MLSYRQNDVIEVPWGLLLHSVIIQSRRSQRAWGHHFVYETTLLSRYTSKRRSHQILIFLLTFHYTPLSDVTHLLTEYCNQMKSKTDFMC